jgi:DNA-binding MarR family transcriptional regulator
VIGGLSTVDGLAQLSFLIHGTLERRAAEHDLSVSQTRLLGILRDRTPTMNELANLLALYKSSVTGLVDRAASRGLVGRLPSPADRRVVRVGLTDEGRSLVSRVASEFEADISTILQELGPADQKALTRLVSEILVSHARRHGIDLLVSEEADEAGIAPPTAASSGRLGE